jgi:arylsulfatase A-like enzyme
MICMDWNSRVLEEDMDVIDIDMSGEGGNPGNGMRSRCGLAGPWSSTALGRLMGRPWSWREAAAGLLILLGLVSCDKKAAEVNEARHVIVISMDTARADHFGFMGNAEAKTPRLDALAGESIVFTDCMTAVPTTLASHTTLFTGKYPHRHGTPRNGYTVNEANEMLPEVLKEAGFSTAGFAASFALESRFGFAQGFDHYDEAFDILAGESDVDQNQRAAEKVTDAVTGYLDAEGVPDRLFLFVHYFDPHRPYAAPAPYDRTFDARGREGLASVMTLRKDVTMSRDERMAHARRQGLQYASEIAYMDFHIGRLLDDLRGRGVLDDALLMVTSDHGENMWDHYMRFDHGNTVFQSTVHTVCMYRLPGAARGGSRVDRLVGNVDIMPTVLGYLGIDAPEGMDGERIDLLDGAGPSREIARFSQASKPHGDLEKNAKWTNIRKSRCIRKGNYKYIQNPHLGSEELYDLESDPGEQSNLLAEPTREIVDLMAGLRRELELWASSADPLQSHFDSATRDETIRRLRSLGYIE